MRTRTPFRAAALCLALLLALCAAFETNAQERDFILFAVAGDGAAPTIDPIVSVSRGGKYVFPEGAGGVDEELQKFSAAYYKEGRTYRVISGGGAAGTLAVKRSHVADECFRAGADVTLESPVKVGRVLMALATDSETLGVGGAGTRRAPTEAERASAMKLAGEVMRQKRATPAAVKTLESINLTAADLDGDGRAELVGSFRTRQGKNARHLLFLIAEQQQQGGAYKAALAEFERVAAADMMDPSLIDEVGNGGFLAEILVDYADLDGDRVAEVVSTASSFEGQGYYIYKRAGGRWSKVYEGSNYRCAY